MDKTRLLLPSQGQRKGEDLVEAFLKDNHIIIRKKKQGKQSLEGNQYDDLLKTVDNLEMSLQKEGVQAVINGYIYVKAFRAFKEVIDSYFKVDLKGVTRIPFTSLNSLTRNLKSALLLRFTFSSNMCLSSQLSLMKLMAQVIGQSKLWKAAIIISRRIGRLSRSTKTITN